MVKSCEIVKNSIGMNNEELAKVLDSLANVYTKLCKYDLAAKLFYELLEIYEKIIYIDFYQVATIYNNLGSVLFAQEKFAVAEPLFLKSVDVRKNNLDEKHIDFLNLTTI